jgi:hypothetical protein
MSRKITKDGRTLRTGKDYTTFRYDLWFSQDGRCIRCGGIAALSEPIYRARSFHVHHKNGRGMGGSKRSDTFLKCEGLCGSCHRIEHNQQSAVPSELKWSRA